MDEPMTKTKILEMIQSKRKSGLSWLGVGCARQQRGVDCE
jgi:hypothetical protein